MELIEAKLLGEWKADLKRCVLSASNMNEDDFVEFTTKKVEPVTVITFNDPNYHLARNGRMYSSVLSAEEIENGLNGDNVDEQLLYDYATTALNLSIDIVRKHLDKPWDWRRVSSHPKITLDTIKNNPDCPWDFDWFCIENPNVTMDLILDNPNEQWDWLSLAYTPCISMNERLNNYMLPWKYLPNISYNLSFTWNHVLNYSTAYILGRLTNSPWNWNIISHHPNITMEIIANNPDRDWNWKKVSKNPNLSLTFIKNNLDKPWNWGFICKNAFQKDIDAYIANGLLRLQLATIHEQINVFAMYRNGKPIFTNAERVFLDEYLMKCVVQY
jgi:hypothetical protein